MAKCTIRFEDGEEDGAINITVNFDPPVDNPLHNEPATYAQYVGCEFFRSVVESLNDDSEAEIEDEQA